MSRVHVLFKKMVVSDVSRSKITFDLSQTVRQNIQVLLLTNTFRSSMWNQLCKDDAWFCNIGVEELCAVAAKFSIGTISLSV